MNKYKKIQTKWIEDIQSQVTIYEHIKTKAKVCTIENDDHNKVFSIAFRTPPINDGGLTHILEHSVLCGSAKYPVKDPFVEMMKGSLNTFLNAFTFPDKTVYPCASQNETDFKNLMSVYLDAVFYPQISKHEEIFMQEGWHYHLLNENDPITYNGVVYNEMKGAFSEPTEVLFSESFHSLYPDTPYHFESGGDPEFIPQLSYRDFLDFHRRYYHPSNSYIFLYGNCDMEERLNWMDEAYLSSFDALSIDTAIPYQKPFSKPKYITGKYPFNEEAIQSKSFLSYNVALNTTLDIKKMIAVQILVQGLLSEPGAPLKQALIDASLAEDVDVMFDDGILQPMISIFLIHTDASKQKQFIEIVDQTLKEIAKNGVDQKSFSSLINFMEFKIREGKFGYMPKGLEIELTCLSSWLYSDEHPFDKLENLKYFAELKEDLKNGYFEQLIEECFLDNPHKTFVSLVPSVEYAEEKERALKEKLDRLKKSLSSSELRKMIEKTKALQAYQSAPSTPEELATLPKLKESDLTLYPEKPKVTSFKKEYPLLWSDYFTNHIAYVAYSFDVSSLPSEELKYTKLWVDLFTYLSTEDEKFTEINQRIKEHTGGLSASLSPYEDAQGQCKTLLTLRFSCLQEKTETVQQLLTKILKNTDFTDKKRLYERLCEIKTDCEMNVANSGHVLVLNRSLSYWKELSYVKDQVSGLGYLDFIEKVVRTFSENADEIIARLQELNRQLFSKKNVCVRFVGTKEQLEQIEPVFSNFYHQLSDDGKLKKTAFVPQALNEGIKAPYDVNFVARSGKFDKEYSGGLRVLEKALETDYLWQKVRVHGGAYGCFLTISRNHSIAMASYRDPSIAETNRVYEQIVEFIRQMNPSDEELLKYKIGAIGAMDKSLVLHASDKGWLAQSNELMGYTYETEVQTRKEIVATTQEDLRRFASYFEEALKTKYICVLGNAKKVEENKDLFQTARDLIQKN